MENQFFTKVKNSGLKNDSCLCVGLDPDPNRIPEHCLKSSTPFYDFLRPIIENTIDLVCAYKPNIAFFEAEGSRGIEELHHVIELIHEIDPDIPVLLDCKRGDIGNTAKAYARAAFQHLKADGVTLNPYLGEDSIEPFAQYPDKGLVILCLTSNKSYTDFQKLEFDGKPLFLEIAKKVSGWNKKNGNFGLVIGATHPEEAALVRNTAPELPFLMPGIGAQGGDASKTMEIGTTNSGFKPIVNSSRGILYAGSEQDYAEKSREAAITLRKRLNSYLDI